MGVFREDKKIRVSRIIDLFVAEGFLKSKEGQTLEEIAEDYLKDFVDRNLILVDKWRWDGRIGYCKMHDLVREVCSKIGEREKIFHRMWSLEIPPDINSVRRLVLDDIPKKENWPEAFFNNLLSASLVRTFLREHDGPLPFKSRLLRVLGCVEFDTQEDIFQHVNLRYLNWSLDHGVHFKLPSQVSLLWNVHTLIFEELIESMNAPLEIWHMRQLRHLRFYDVLISDPPPSEKVEQHDDVLLPNLLTLSNVVNFSFTEEVCKRIPNIKKLGILQSTVLHQGECPKVCQYYLGNLYKLQSLFCSFDTPERGEFLQSLVLPSLLRKLSLSGCGLHWEDINTFGLSLPYLKVLKLAMDSVVGPEWDCIEEAFPRLKVLHMTNVNLIKWTAESSNCFPVLEVLYLHSLEVLERIPSDIGETLGSLRVDWCNVSTAISSIEILEELSLGNEDFQLQLWIVEHEMEFLEKVDVKSFTSKNLKFSSRRIFD